MIRWFAIVLLIGSLLAAVVYDRVEIADQPAEVAPSPVGPVAEVVAGRLSSVWYCPIATVDGVEGRLTIANVGEEASTVTVSLASKEGGGPTVQLTVAPQAAQVVAVGELSEAETAGAVVEGVGGRLVVGHDLATAAGTAAGGCATRAATTWAWAGGATTRDRRELIVVLNPQPHSAVFTMRFGTGLRERDLERSQVPGRSVVVVDVTEQVAREALVSIELEAQSGVVAERLSVADGALGPSGAALTLGVSESRSVWYLPAGLVGEGGDNEIVVRNLTDRSAELDIELVGADAAQRAALGLVPIELTVGPERVETVDLDDLAAQFRWPPGLPLGLVVRSVNTVPVVVERRDLLPPIDTSLIGAGGDEAGGAEGTGDSEESAPGTDGGEAPPALEPLAAEGDTGLALSVGSAVTSTGWWSAPLPASGTVRVHVLAPDGAEVTVRPTVAGVPLTAAGLSLEAGSQGFVDLAELGDLAVVSVTADRPVVAAVTIVDAEARTLRLPLVPVTG